MASALRVGFLGCGNMGSHMVANLLAKGHAVTAFDPSAAARDWVSQRGARVVSSVEALRDVEDIEMIVTMLPSNDAVLKTYEILGTRQYSLCVDSSTVDPAVSLRVYEDFLNGRPFVDAPVSGGVTGAAAGTLTFMVGGPHYAVAKPLLVAMGSNIVECGGSVGTGEIVKLCNNMILGISMLGVCEGMNLGVSLGMDGEALAKILNTSTARCWSSDTYNPCPNALGEASKNLPAARAYEGGFGSSLMLKDLGLACDSAQSNGIPVPMGQSAKQYYANLCDDARYATKDFGVVYEKLRMESNK